MVFEMSFGVFSFLRADKERSRGRVFRFLGGGYHCLK